MNNNISIVYKNDHPLPVNKQAVKEFFYDHESVEPDFSGKTHEMPVSIQHFKKSTEFRDKVSNDVPIDVVDYERISSSIRRTKKENLPYKYKKLVKLVMHIAKCNKNIAMKTIAYMTKERFIKITGEFVEYF